MNPPVEDPNFVVLALMKELDASSGLTNDQLIAMAKRVQTAQAKAKELLLNAEDRLISGTPGTVYLKRKGHRELSAEDVESLIFALGTHEDKQALEEFPQAQDALTQRLKALKSIIGFILEQADLPYFQYYKRMSKPELWKPEQVIQVAEVLNRLKA